MADMSITSALYTANAAVIRATEGPPGPSSTSRLIAPRRRGSARAGSAAGSGARDDEEFFAARWSRIARARSSA